MYENRVKNDKNNFEIPAMIKNFDMPFGSSFWIDERTGISNKYFCNYLYPIYIHNLTCFFNHIRSAVE